MQIRFASRLMVVSGLVGLAVLVMALLIQPAAADHSIDRPGPIAPPAQAVAVVTDTRWLNLVTSIRPRAQLSAGLPTLYLHLTDQIVAGQVATGGTVYISITRGSQIFGYRQAQPFLVSGSYMYMTGWSCYYEQMSAPQGGGLPYCSTLQTGDVIWVNQAGAGISLTVPALTALADVSGDSVYGVAPISQSVAVYLYPFAAPDQVYTQAVQAAADGHYSASFTPTLDVQARDTGYVRYSQALDRAVYVRFVAPQLRALINGREVVGYAAPNAVVLITATQADGTPRAQTTAYSAGDGRFSAVFYDTAALQPTEHLLATAAGQTVSMTVMTVTAQIDLANGRVTGQALPDQPIEVARLAGPLNGYYLLFGLPLPLEQTTITATATGQYTATLTLARPNFGLVSLTQADGHQTVAAFVVPYLNVQLGSHRADYMMVTGQIGDRVTPITLTIQGAGGYLKDVRQATTQATGYFYTEIAALRLAAGDVLTVTSPRGVQTSFVTPELTGQLDPDTDIISGTAPAHAPVTIGLNYYYQVPTGGGYPPPSNSGYITIVTADAQGRYSLDLHGVLDLLWYTQGEVQVTTSDGHRAARALEAQPSAACLARPENVALQGNLIRVMVTGNCQAYGQVVLRLRAPNGQLTAQYSYGWHGYSGSQWFSAVLFDTVGRPVVIAPRDTVELTWSDWTTPPTLAPTTTPWPVWTSTPTLTPTPTRTPTPMATQAARPRPASAPWQGRPAQTTEYFQSYTVPTLTAQLDLTANVIKGEAPANASLNLTLWRAYMQGFTATVDAQGHYTLSVNSVADRLGAGDRAQVSWQDGLGVQWYTYGVAPLFKVSVGGNSLDLRFPPLTPLTITLRSLSGQGWTLTGQTPYDGLLYLYPQSSPIGVGDQLTLTTPQTVTTLIVPDLVAQIDRATATVYGRAPAGAS
ncbi:MAG: hypothetical protein KA765_16540, partial [Thermoflexales bacterium]|nr:hypothetical protein [Thermoflexales bacterium]